jgi:small subunit ribosomal protein S3
MGQKVNPHGLRIGIISGWDTQWCAGKKDFARLLSEDHKIRTFLKKKYFQNGISRIGIERAADKVIINIYTAKPGMMIGIKGAGIDVIKKEVGGFIGDKQPVINIHEVKRPDLDALLVAEGIAAQLEKRASFRRTMKQSITRTMRAGAKGVKIMCAGRLDGAEIARTEHYHEGSIPLQTLRADIDFATAPAHTTMGCIGVKVWIYKGEIIGQKSLTTSDNQEGQRNVNA